MTDCKHYADLYGRCIDCGATWEQRAGTAMHPVPGLPVEVYTVRERIAAGKPRFFPRMHGRPVLRADGSHAWYSTLEEARADLLALVARMQ